MALAPGVSLWSYYQAIGQPWRKELDSALDLFLSLESQEKSFWHDYEQRVNHYLETEFYDEVVTRNKVKRKLVQPFKRIVRTFSEMTNAQLENVGNLPPNVNLVPLDKRDQTKNTDNQDIYHEDVFRHSTDFRSVTLHGKKFSLTSPQAQVIERLYEAYQNGTPDVGQDALLVELELQSTRLRDIFKSTSEVWGTLVMQGKKKGTYRLNI
jgi:hypothetical protein